MSVVSHTATIPERSQQRNFLTFKTGPTVTNGYYLSNVQDHDAKQDGWLRTGDMGLVDHDSYVYVTGRNKVCQRARIAHKVQTTGLNPPRT